MKPNLSTPFEECLYILLSNIIYSLAPDKLSTYSLEEKEILSNYVADTIRSIEGIGEKRCLTPRLEDLRGLTR